MSQIKYIMNANETSHNFLKVNLYIIQFLFIVLSAFRNTIIPIIIIVYIKYILQ